MKKEENVSAGDICGMIIVMVLAGFSVFGMVNFLSGGETTQVEQELANYKTAISFCGQSNVVEHHYNNGTTDFNCRDYSLLVK